MNVKIRLREAEIKTAIRDYLENNYSQLTDEMPKEPTIRFAGVRDARGLRESGPIEEVDAEIEMDIPFVGPET